MKLLATFKNSTGVKFTQLKNVVSTDELRPVMRGVYVDFLNQKLVGTNSHILASYPIECEKQDTDIEGVIINPKLFNPAAWIDHVKGLESLVEFNVYEEKTDVVFREKIIASASNIEGKFPNYKAVFPSIFSPQSNVYLDKNLLKKVCNSLPSDFDKIDFKLGTGLVIKFEAKDENDLKIEGIIMSIYKVD